MHQWKKILAERKLIKAVAIEGCKISITLHDQYNNPDNFCSINNMFANLWYLNPEFTAVFERAAPHKNAPFLKLKKKNTYLSTQEALDALIDFGRNHKHAKAEALPTDEEIVQEVKVANPKKKRGELHPWKKLLSKGKLIQSLDIKDSLVYIKPVDKYNQRSFFKGINIMLKKLYDASTDCQEMYRRPTSHSSSPYLILLVQNAHPDPVTLLNGLINMAKQRPKQHATKVAEISSEKVSIASVTQAAKAPATPLQQVAKVEDIYGIFKELLEDPIIDLDFPEFSLTDIESDRPFLGFEFALPKKLSDVFAKHTTHDPVANDDRKVPILYLKLKKD